MNILIGMTVYILGVPFRVINTKVVFEREIVTLAPMLNGYEAQVCSAEWLEAGVKSGAVVIPRAEGLTVR